MGSCEVSGFLFVLLGGPLLVLGGPLRVLGGPWGSLGRPLERLGCEGMRWQTKIFPSLGKTKV